MVPNRNRAGPHCHLDPRHGIPRTFPRLWLVPEVMPSPPTDSPRILLLAAANQHSHPAPRWVNPKSCSQLRLADSVTLTLARPHGLAHNRADQYGHPTTPPGAPGIPILICQRRDTISLQEGPRSFSWFRVAGVATPKLLGGPKVQPASCDPPKGPGIQQPAAASGHVDPIPRQENLGSRVKLWMGGTTNLTLLGGPGAKIPPLAPVDRHSDNNFAGNA